ncbi:MAG: 2Fe-2S iron-sulfur cluster-binding protein [Dehalococcoidia bacterium]
MAKLRIRPLGIEIDVSDGETIMSAAQARGYYWPTTCGGEGRCTTCACIIVSGAEHLSPRGRSEERVLVEERGPSVLQRPVRLACQTQVHGGEVEVEKPGVRLPLSPSGSPVSMSEPEE